MMNKVIQINSMRPTIEELYVKEVYPNAYIVSEMDLDGNYPLVYVSTGVPSGYGYHLSITRHLYMYNTEEIWQHAWKIVQEELLRKLAS